jgi:hypothetical protein
MTRTVNDQPTDLTELCAEPDFGSKYEKEIEEAFPKWKDVNCPFCGARLRLIRRGKLLSSGEPRFYYVEKTYADDWQNHTCKSIDPCVMKEASPSPRRPSPTPQAGQQTLFDETS